MSAETDSGYESYGLYLKDEIAAQDARKASFEQRGLAVVTTSGTLVTLLLALAAFSTKEADTFLLPTDARTWLSRALSLFLVSAAAALLSNLPLPYKAVEPDQIKGRMKNDEFASSADAATKDIALTRVKTLISAKRQNSRKGWVVFSALVLEILAVGCLAKAVWIIL